MSGGAGGRAVKPKKCQPSAWDLRHGATRVGVVGPGATRVNGRRSAEGGFEDDLQNKSRRGSEKNVQASSTLRMGGQCRV